MCWPSRHKQRLQHRKRGPSHSTAQIRPWKHAIVSYSRPETLVFSLNKEHKKPRDRCHKQTFKRQISKGTTKPWSLQTQNNSFGLKNIHISTGTETTSEIKFCDTSVLTAIFCFVSKFLYTYNLFILQGLHCTQSQIKQ